MVDMREFFDGNEAMKLPSQWTADMGPALSSFDVVKRNLTTGDGKTDEVFRILLADKVRSLEMLAKHFGLLVDRVDHSGAVIFIHEQLDTPVTIESSSVPNPKGRTHDVAFALLGQQRLARPSRQKWATSIQRTFGVDPLLDGEGQRMHWTRRLPPEQSR